jgi:hypothetical protein
MDIIKPFLCESFDINCIKYSKVKQDRDGKKTIYLFDNNGNKIYIQTPKLSNTLNLVKKNKYYHYLYE